MWWMPILTALGINAGKNILTGHNPLKGSVEAGITGGVTGGLLDTPIPGAEVASPAAGSIAADTTMKQIGDTFYNPEYFAGTSFNAPIYTGGEGLLSNAASEAGSMLGKLAPDNLSGVASLLSDSQDTSQYRQMAGTGGGMKQGSGGKLAVEFPQAKVFKRRKV